MTDEPMPWSTIVTVEVDVEIEARPGEHYEDSYDRTPEQLAQAAVWRYTGIDDLSRADGWADMIGHARIVDVREA